jgi:acetyl esterase
MPLDDHTREVIAMLDARSPAVELGTVESARAAMRAMPPPADAEPVAHVADDFAPGPEGAIPVRVYHPATGVKRSPGIVYLHGGGWVLCDLDTHDGACRRVANRVGAVVVSVDYRLAPEHKFPAGLSDAHAATLWAAANADRLGIDDSRLAIAGDSAGGNLAAAVATMTRDRGDVALAFQLLVYPVVDNSHRRNTYPSKTENATGYRLTTAAMEWYRLHYLERDEHGEDPLASPIRTRDLAGLPPACIVTAEFDPLRDEGEAYGRALARAGVDVTVHRAPGMFHGFFNMDALLPGAALAQDIAFEVTARALRP